MKIFKKISLVTVFIITYPLFIGLRQLETGKKPKGFISDVKELWSKE